MLYFMGQNSPRHQILYSWGKTHPGYDWELRGLRIMKGDDTDDTRRKKVGLQTTEDDLQTKEDDLDIMEDGQNSINLSIIFPL